MASKQDPEMVLEGEKKGEGDIGGKTGETRKKSVLFV